MRINNFSSDELKIKHFEIVKGESWCVYGTNTSGVSNFLKLFSNDQDTLEGVSFSKKPTVISFARQQEIFEEELQKDDSDFLDQIDPGTPARDFIADPEKFTELIKDFKLQHCLDKGFRQLSSGESRKLLLISSLSHNPGLLVIENPYDGVDEEGCRELDYTLGKLAKHGHQILITVNNPEDIPDWCSHLAIFRNGSIAHQGPSLQSLHHFNLTKNGDKTVDFQLETENQGQKEEREELIFLENGFARYGDRLIFSDLQLSVYTGQHTLITGPNGCGKSTLLQIITGDNQNCYANNLRMFGKQRGSGESIWELKKQMGIVSPDLHRNHYIPGSSLQVVLSGFFDSIGIYRKVSEGHKKQAIHWLEMAGLADKVQTSFRRLSYAEQRLCLIARALIKMPPLLVLDEPTQGLDHQNRNSLLTFLETITEKKLSTILYVSHRTDEFRSFFKQHLDLSTSPPELKESH